MALGFLRSIVDLGTTPLEAAMMARNIAPDFNCKFAVMAWTSPPQRSWGMKNVRDAYNAKADYDSEAIIAFDINYKAIYAY